METYTLRFVPFDEDERLIVHGETTGESDVIEIHELELDAEQPTVEIVDGYVQITCEENGVIAAIPTDRFHYWVRFQD